jgi:hypothetical protein
MWILIISLYTQEPLAQSQGIIHVPQPDHSTCIVQRDLVKQQLKLDRYTTAARCVTIPHYNLKGANQ